MSTVKRGHLISPVASPILTKRRSRLRRVQSAASCRNRPPSTQRPAVQRPQTSGGLPHSRSARLGGSRPSTGTAAGPGVGTQQQAPPSARAWVVLEPDDVGADDGGGAASSGRGGGRTAFGTPPSTGRLGDTGRKSQRRRLYTQSMRASSRSCAAMQTMQLQGRVAGGSLSRSRRTMSGATSSYSLRTTQRAAYQR